MTPVHSRMIDAPSAWTPASLGGKEGLVRTLTRRQLDAVDQLLVSTRAIETVRITRQNFEHPDLTPLLAEVKDEIKTGKGVAIVRGIDTTTYAQEDCERIFWGFATHWGQAAVQSARADRIGYVRDEPDDPVRRGYRSSRELVLHTDARPVIGLMTIQVAESGGISQVASGSTIHNIMLQERPDLLAPLYEGYYYASSEIGLTSYKIPVFSQASGVVSCAFFEPFMRAAAKRRGEALPPDLDEALDYFSATAQRDDVNVSFLLEPGEILLSNNFVVLHARTEFQNSAARQRLLLRLWLNDPEIRPLVPELLARSAAFDERYDPEYRAST